MCRTCRWQDGKLDVITRQRRLDMATKRRSSFLPIERNQSDAGATRGQRGDIVRLLARPDNCCVKTAGTLCGMQHIPQRNPGPLQSS